MSGQGGLFPPEWKPWQQGMPDHDGETYQRSKDKRRLNKQTLEVYGLMQDGTWRTLRQISRETGHPEASVSARLRDLRKAKFGGHHVERRRRMKGLWEYKLKTSFK